MRQESSPHIRGSFYYACPDENDQFSLVLAKEIADDLQAALEQFTAIAEKLKS